MVLVQFVCNQCQGTVTVCIHYDVSLPQRIISLITTPLLYVKASHVSQLKGQFTLIQEAYLLQSPALAHL